MLAGVPSARAPADRHGYCADGDKLRQKSFNDLSLHMNPNLDEV